MKKFVIKDRKKFNRFIIILMIVSFLSISVISAALFPKEVRGLSETKSIKVSTGDTLWDIAYHLKQDKDIREIVYDIYKLNNLNPSSPIYPGQILQLPVY